MPRVAPIILIFEQHSFSSSSETVTALVKEGWCSEVGFELPSDWTLADLKVFYQGKFAETGFPDEGKASTELDAALNPVTMKRGATSEAALDRMSEDRVKRVLTVRKFFTAQARLKLLDMIEKNEASVRTLDLTLEEKAKLSGAVIPSDAKAALASVMRALPSRNASIINLIVTSKDAPMACILGLQHAHVIINELRSRGFKIFPCFVRDAWAKDLRVLHEVIDSSYPPAVRSADGLLEFSSVSAAMDSLRDLLLPYFFTLSIPLGAPTSLVDLLRSKTSLPFYGVKNDMYQVSAITELLTPGDKAIALSICMLLGRGSFFRHGAKDYFGLAGVNLARTSLLPDKIFNHYSTPSK